MKNKESQVIEKKTKRRFKLLPTILPEIEVKSEPGTELNLSSGTFELFYNLSQEYARKHWKITSLNKQQKEQREKITKMAKANNGLRGIISERDSFNLTVSPTEKVSWNRDKLRKSMGALYSLAVKEVTTISITIPPVGTTRKNQEELVEKVMKRALIHLGINRKEIDKLIRKEISIDVDQEKLDEMVAQDKVKLLPKTKKSEITWRIRVDPLKGNKQ